MFIALALFAAFMHLIAYVTVAAYAGASFVVLRSGVHAESDIAASLKRLATAGVQVQGGIFNAVSPRSRSFSRAGYAAVQEYLNA